MGHAYFFLGNGRNMLNVIRSLREQRIVASEFRRLDAPLSLSVWAPQQAVEATQKKQQMLLPGCIEFYQNDLLGSDDFLEVIVGENEDAILHLEPLVRHLFLHFVFILLFFLLRFFFLFFLRFFT